jgi:hypothetical protein
MLLRSSSIASAITGRVGGRRHFGMRAVVVVL